ncbi:hypothetical protein GYMLUDRAFT_39365 [Collybiopsis luxurians FD-317 M1]|nr:hypothetical protein GYMLUDRAFT_39365 [Collybiopsis luxurians FD-317 M1]
MTTTHRRHILLPNGLKPVINVDALRPWRIFIKAWIGESLPFLGQGEGRVESRRRRRREEAGRGGRDQEEEREEERSERTRK